VSCAQGPRPVRRLRARRLLLAVYEVCIDKLLEPDSTPSGWQKRAQLFVKAAEVAGLSDLISGEDGR
jgi:hypothetical protein